MPLSVGDKIGPYQALVLLGKGGMGEVWKARDTRLGRIVAIKTSQQQFSERFAIEARAIAALNHPNICQLYDVGASYLVMEFVDGAPIATAEQPRPLSPAAALPLALQIVAALEAAHVKGIAHRDLKPANILVTSSGAVKLLDFGLAKLSTPEPATEDETQAIGLTQNGVIMGTPSYMSPEQAEGRPAGIRSDIFSFGVVLYELLAGRRAFPGRSAAAVMGAVVHKEPDPLPAGIPPRLAAVVNKCLAKSPEARYASATELRAALEATAIPNSTAFRARATAIGAGLLAALGISVGISFWMTSHSRERIDSVAVLPFEIRSNDPDADYISDGITESINNTLSRLPDLKVISHSIALHYKGKPSDAQKTGAELHTDAVIIGRIAQHADELTIAMELDDVRTGKQLWGERYVRKVADLLTVQQEIAGAVSARLRSGLSPSDRQQLVAKGSTTDPEAYRLYLKGKYHTSKFTREEFSKGIEFFNQAIARDPGYALAYGGLAYYYILQDDWYMSPAVSASRAKAAAEKALAIDETNADAHFALALELHWYEWNWSAAEREFRRSIALNPGYADAYGLYAWFLADMGRRSEAVSLAAKAQRTDALSLLANFAPGAISVFARQWDPAIQQLRSAIDLDKTYWLPHCFLGRAYEAKGRLPEAIESFHAALQLDPQHSEIWSALGHAYAISGQTAEATKVLAHLKALSATSYVAPYNVAIVYAGLGDRDRTFSWLEQSFRDRGFYLPVFLTTDSRLDPFHNDPRYIDLVHRVGLPGY